MQSSAALYNINSLRYFATFLLVSYHVIGIDEEGGMKLGYPSAWRFLGDALIDVRMPLFAFIAGVVYALKPITLANISGFAVGKFRRIVVPGIVASVIFWLSCNLILENGFAYGADPISAVLLDMGHFWFLQAILLIFAIVGWLDAVLKYRATAFLFLGALGLSFVWKQLPIPEISYLQIDGAIYLAPYFILGMFLFRNHDAILARKRIVVLAATCLFIAGILVNIGIYRETGQLSMNRFDPQSFAVGIGAILLAQFTFPRSDLFDRLAFYSFTIYLYHPFGTSAVRRLIETLDTNSPMLQFVLGVSAGLAVPCLIHVFADRYDWSRCMLLGLRPKTPTRFTVTKSI